MTKKQKVSPKVKHKPFASFCTKLQDQDWMIGIFNPNDKTAAYFLAEPTPKSANPPHGGLKETSKAKIAAHHSGFVVSALSRQGLVESTITGLPRKFKAVEDAMEWLEGQIDQYAGDGVPGILTAFETDADVISDFKTVGVVTGRTKCSEDIQGNIPKEESEYSSSMNNFSSKVVELGEKIHAELEKQFISSEDSGRTSGPSVKTGKVVLKHKAASDAARAKKSKETKGKNGSKSTKTAASDAPYVKPEVKFKTHKQELESLGLGELFQELPYK